MARRLPSLGVGAWRCAPLLPWRLQCPVCVCAALAAGSGGFGPVPAPMILAAVFPQNSKCRQKGVFSRKMTYFFGFYGPKIAGGVLLPKICPKISKTLKFGLFVSPLLPPSRPACSALRVAGPPVRVSLTLARWYAIPCGLCVPRARSGCPSGSPRVSFSCVCACALAVSAPRWVVWRAHLAWSRHWALVGPFHVVRAPPRVLPRSAMGLQGSNILYCNYLQNARCFGNAKIPKMQRCNVLQQDLTPCSSTITKSVERSLNHCSKGPCAEIIVIQWDNQNNCTLHRS